MQSLKYIRRYSSGIKPYDAIPGPKFFSRELLPGGELYKKPFLEIHRFYREKYGNIVRFPGFFGRPGLLFVYDPEDFSQVFRSAGKWPKRPAFSSIKHYRKQIRTDVFPNGGLLAE